MKRWTTSGRVAGILLAPLAVIGAFVLATAFLRPAPALLETAVDQCLLKEYLNECPGEETGTREEILACEKQAPLAATRVRAAVPLDCRK
jgi:hypothetical protein